MPLIISKMWNKIKTFIARNILDVLLMAVFSLSCFSLYRTYVNEEKIARNTASITTIQSDIVKLQKDLDSRLDAIQAQLDFIAKYSEANYLYFYGDVDGRNSSIHTKSTNKTKNK